MFSIDQSFWLFILYLIPFGLAGLVITLVLLKLCKVQITKTVIYILSICVLIAFFLIVLMAKLVSDYVQRKHTDIELTEELVDSSQEEVSTEAKYDGPSEEELREIVEEAIRIKTNR